MSTTVAVAPPRDARPAGRLRRRRARQPQWGVYVVALAGWALLLAAEMSPGGGAHPHTSAGYPLTTHAVLVVAMVAAMAPLVADNVRYAALRAPRRTRRAVAVAVFGGWAAVWLLVAAGLALLGWIAARGLGQVGSILVASTVAVAWQWSPAKRLGLSRCHRLLAPPLERSRARAAAVRHGCDLGRSCVTTCAPLMALMVVAGHGVVVVAALTTLAWHERRRRPHHDAGRARTATVIAVTGATALVLALLAPR